MSKLDIAGCECVPATIAHFFQNKTVFIIPKAKLKTDNSTLICHKHFNIGHFGKYLGNTGNV
jgi:hypothetical protein